MWRQISGWQIVDLGTLSYLIVTGWHRWRSGQRWSRVWCQLSVSVGWMCIRSVATPACVQILCSASVAMTASIRVVLMKHSRVSSYHTLDLLLPRRLSFPLLHISDFGARFLDQILHFLHCGTPKPPFGHFGQIQSQVHIGLFQLDPTSLPCHCSKHVENLQDISCCFQQWDLATTSTI